MALCHCLSGGLPRELIRTARALIQLNAEINDPQGGELAALTQRLVEADRQAKTDAVWVAVRRVQVEPHVTTFSDWLQDVEAAPVEPNHLLDQIRQFWECQERWLAVSDPSDGERADLERLSQLALEVNGYRYFAATLLQFFSSGLSDQHLVQATTARNHGSIERLARARLLFAQGPVLAWNLVTAFRNARELTPSIDTPKSSWLADITG